MGASYHEKIATSEVVQLSTEGVEQLETYFGKYLPQLFYSLLAPVTLFIVLSATASVMDIVAYGGAAVGMIVAANEFLHGRIDFGQTMCIVLLASEFFIPLRLLGSFFHIAMNGMAASDKIFHLLDLEEEKTRKTVFNKEQLKKLSVEMDNVCFSYQKEREILHGVSLKIPAGSFVSLVGESGCGKSTIASLLAGKNRGYSGQITLGGVPIADLSEAELMRHVTVVRHNSYLFKGTVRDNLRLARPDVTEKEMKEALEKVNLWGYLQGQEGLDTSVSENGENFSGGQCQRLSMARALLHDSEMYIFDEATSNIDAESEEMIMEVVHELVKRKTVLLISHRLFNVVPSDCIYMLQNGVVTESGTHKELMAEKGAYYHLYERQRELERFGKGRVAVG